MVSPCFRIDCESIICIVLLLHICVSILSAVLTGKIEELGEELRTHFNIEEFSPVSLPVQVQDAAIIILIIGLKKSIMIYLSHVFYAGQYYSTGAGVL